MLQPRPIMKDLSQKTSSTNPDFVTRVSDALGKAEVEEEILNGTFPDFPGWKEVNEQNRARTVAEHTYRGFSKANTELTQRIAAASERPAQTFDEKGEQALAEGKELQKAFEAQQKARQRGWKTSKGEFDNIINRLGEEDFSINN